MKMSKAFENAILLTLYADRAGRCTLSDVSQTQGVSLHFLEQIACKLRRAGILQSFRGPGGGYEVDGNPTVLDVITAMGYKRLGYGKALMSTSPEIRALGNVLSNLQGAQVYVLNRKIKSLNHEIAANEVAAMETFPPGATVN